MTRLGEERLRPQIWARVQRCVHFLTVSKSANRIKRAPEALIAGYDFPLSALPD